MSAQLLPCAHCGSPAKFMQVERKSINQGGEYIDCTNKACGATSVLMFAIGEDVKSILAERWNKRAALSISDVEILKIRDSIKCGDGWDGDKFDIALCHAMIAAATRSKP